MLKIDEIRAMKTEKLVTTSNEIRAEITEMRRRIHMGETQNTRVLRAKRRDLARVLTVLGQELVKEKA